MLPAHVSNTSLLTLGAAAAAGAAASIAGAATAEVSFICYFTCGTLTLCPDSNFYSGPGVPGIDPICTLTAFPFFSRQFKPPLATCHCRDVHDAGMATTNLARLASRTQLLACHPSCLWHGWSLHLQCSGASWQGLNNRHVFASLA